MLSPESVVTLWVLTLVKAGFDQGCSNLHGRFGLRSEVDWLVASARSEIRAVVGDQVGVIL